MLDDMAIQEKKVNKDTFYKFIHKNMNTYS